MVVESIVFSNYYCTCGELTSISNGKHIVPRLFLNIWSPCYCMVALRCSICLNIEQTS
jgi:hypothetical protein